MRILLALHAIVLLLASTGFTIVTAFLGNASIQWCYFKEPVGKGFAESDSEMPRPSPGVIGPGAFAVGAGRHGDVAAALSEGDQVAGSLADHRLGNAG